jgi:hypothetical protein
MLRNILVSAAAVAMLTGVAAAHSAAPSPAGLTIGAPVGNDTNGEKVVVGERR